MEQPPTTPLGKKEFTKYTEENPRFHSQNNKVVDMTHGQVIELSEVIYLLNQAEFTIQMYKDFEGKLRWATKGLPSNQQKRGFEG